MILEKAAIRELTRNYANEIINTEQIKKSKGDPKLEVFEKKFAERAMKKAA